MIIYNNKNDNKNNNNTIMTLSFANLSIDNMMARLESATVELESVANRIKETKEWVDNPNKSILEHMALLTFSCTVLFSICYVIY